MEINWSIVGWIAALVFVYIFGLFEGRNQGYKKRKGEEAPETQDQSAPKPATVTVDDPGLLRIKNENGSLALDLDGARVNTSSFTPDQRRRLIEMLNLMRPWLEGKPAPAPTMTTPPPPLSGQPISAPVKPASPTPQPVPQPSDQTQSKPAAPRPTIIAKEDRPATPANSIVAQIDAILQAHLDGTPLEERGVFLAQSPEGSVMVYVGLTRYMGVDEVPDEEIKAAIRVAIEEWERKYTPGLG